MKRKAYLFIAIVSALMLASCNGNGGKESENGTGLAAQESSVAAQGSTQGSVDTSSASDSSAAPTETSAPAETVAPTETSAPAETVAPTETPASAETVAPTETPAPAETSAPAEKRTPSEKQLPGEPFDEPGEDPTPIPNDTELHGYNKIKLSGKRSDHVITKKFSYLRSDKCVLFFEDDLDLPGDLKKNIDLIMDTIEDVVGLPYNAPNFTPILGNYTHFESNPWDGIELNGRVAIFFYVDREDAGYICSADAEAASIFMYEFYTDEVWNSVPSYRDNSWRRQDYIDYYTIAHELTHSLTTRYANMTEIMTEGCADYVAEVVMERLKDTSKDFAKSYEQMQNNFEHRIKKPLTKDNAEEIFIDDFSELAMVDREEKYILGRMICEYLSESYGEAFLRDYLIGSKNLSDRFSYARLTLKQRESYAKKFKYIFGENAFVDFAEWYQENSK